MEFDYCVYIGRFQPFHDGHLQVLNHALSIAKKVVVVLGSCYGPRSIKNPWNFVEREMMIINSVGIDARRLKFIQMKDYHYNDQKWEMELKSKLDQVIPKGSKVALTGSSEDETDYTYLFPEWCLNSAHCLHHINGTWVRDRYFNDNDWEALLPEGTKVFLTSFQKHQAFPKLKDEYRDYAVYKDAWSGTPYPPTFITVNSIVMQDGHILLIEKTANPGKKLLSLPGGSVHPSERLLDAATRHLEEETGVVVYPDHLVDTDYFDYPDRSLRGRSITHGFFFKLSHNHWTYFSGVQAYWMSVEDCYKSEEFFYEDHLHIIRRFTEGEL